MPDDKSLLQNVSAALAPNRRARLSENESSSVKSTTCSALTISLATKSNPPKPSARPLATLRSPDYTKPENISGDSLRRLPRPSFTTLMNC